MKKLLLIAVIAVFGFTSVNGQTEKGNWMFSGNTSISFASTTGTLEVDGEEIDDEENKVSVFTISPSAGYFIIDNLAVGVELSFSSIKNELNGGDVTTSNFMILPGGTYYFEVGDNLKPYIGLGAGFISGSTGDDDSQKSSGLAIRGKGGLAYFINDSVAIDFSVQYLNTSQTNKEFDELKVKNSSIGVGIGFSIFL